MVELDSEAEMAREKVVFMKNKDDMAKEVKSMLFSLDPKAVRI